MIVQSNAWKQYFTTTNLLGGKIKISIFSCLLVLVEVVCAVEMDSKTFVQIALLLLLQQRSKSQFMNYAAYAYEQLSRKSPM